MNYIKIHDAIIERGCRLGKYQDYMELHHITPKCLGGSNEKSNLVYLTAREHFIVHQLLTKIHKGHIGLIKAAVIMSKKTKFNHRHCSKQYSWLKKISSDANKILSSKKKGVKRSEEDCKKIKDALNRPEIKKKHVDALSKSNKSMRKRKIVSEALLGVPKSDEMKRKMSIVASNRTEEHRRNLIISNTGKLRTDETKKNISNALKNAPMGICPHCQKEGKMMGGFVSWHFDRCRMKK